MTASLRDIRLFVAAYEERSFTVAADREHATQSGVSQHIAKLEQHFQVRLFTRDKGRVAPTPAADAYYTRCLDVLRAHDAAGASLAGHTTGLTGEISVGLMPTMTRSALAPALTRFTAAHPNVTVRIVEAYSGVLTRDVRAGIFDFAIVPAFAGQPGLKVRPFLTTPETLVSRNVAGGRLPTGESSATKQNVAGGRLPTGESPATKQNGARHHLRPVRLADLGPLKLVLPGPANTRRQTLITYFAANGVEIERTIELDAMMGTLDTVAGSDWVTVLPGVMMAAEVERASFTVNPILDPPLDLDLVVIEPARRAMSPPAAAFFQALELETHRLNDCWKPYLIAAKPDRRRTRSNPGR